MKTAIIIPGRLDTFEDVFPSFKEYVLDVFQPDIFFAGYPNIKGLEYCEQKLIELWNPKKYILRRYTEEVRREIHPNDSRFLERKRSETNPHTWLSGMYNVKLANSLKESYEQENNFTYDICIKVRTDCIWHTHITLEELELAKQDKNILIPAAWNFSEIHPLGTSDVAALCNSKTMNKYAAFMDYVDYYYDQGNQFHPESMLGIHIHHMGLNRIAITTGKDPFSHIPNQSGWVVVDPNPNRRQLG